MKRQANWTPVIVANGFLQNGRGAVRPSDDVVCRALAAPLVTYVGAPREVSTKSLEQENQRQADFQFSVGVAIVFALPVFIALSVYATAVLFT